MTLLHRSEPLVEVGPGLYAWLAGGLATNSGFIVAADEVVVVDSLMTPTLARNLIAQVRRVTNKPITYLVNTHHHGDHVLGNGVFPSAHIVAHDKCRQVIEESWQFHMRRYIRRDPAIAQDYEGMQMRLPDITFSNRLTLYVGGRQLEFIYTGHGHTPDDIVVYLPQERVLFAGDLLFTDMMPAMHDANIQGWIDAIGQVLAWDFDPVVPGHGPVSTRRGLLDERTFLTALRSAALDCFRQGMTEDDAIQAIRLEEYSRWPAQERLPIAIRRLYGELSGGIR